MKYIYLLCFLFLSIILKSQTVLIINQDSLTLRTDTYSKTFTEITMVEGSKSINKFTFSGSNYTQTFYTNAVNQLSVNGTIITPSFDNILTSIKNFASTHGASSGGGGAANLTEQTFKDSVLVEIANLKLANAALSQIANLNMIGNDSLNSLLNAIKNGGLSSFGNVQDDVAMYTATQVVATTNCEIILVENTGTTSATVIYQGVSIPLEVGVQREFFASLSPVTHKRSPIGTLTVNGTATAPILVTRKFVQ